MLRTMNMQIALSKLCGHFQVRYGVFPKVLYLGAREYATLKDEIRPYLSMESLASGEIRWQGIPVEEVRLPSHLGAGITFPVDAPDAIPEPIHTYPSWRRNHIPS